MSILLRLLARLPLKFLHRLGAGLGFLMAWLPSRSLRYCRRNIQVCFPEMDAADQRRLVVETMKHVGRTALETPYIWHCPPQQLDALVIESRGESCVRGAREQGRGVLIIGPHLGSWELVSLYCSLHYPMTSLYRTLRFPSLEHTVRSGRERLGATLVPTDNRGVRALFKALSEGGLVGIPPDQDPRDSGGLFAPFFGIQANTMTLASRLAAKSGALCVLVVAERLDDGKGFRMHFEPLPEAVGGQDLQASVTLLNQAVEAMIRRFPAQYQWIYRRFRTRPKGEPVFYAKKQLRAERRGEA